MRRSSGASATSSSAYLRRRSPSPKLARMSMRTFWPFVHPNCFSPSSKASMRACMSKSSASAPVSTPIRRIRSLCCANAVSGQIVADPAITLMKSRRRIARPEAQDHANCVDDYSRDLQLAKWGSEVSLHGSNAEPFMSALGQKQTFRSVRAMSALSPKADID